MSAIEILLDYILGKVITLGKRALSNTDEFLNYDVSHLLRNYYRDTEFSMSWRFRGVFNWNQSVAEAASLAG